MIPETIFRRVAARMTMTRMNMNMNMNMHTIINVRNNGRSLSILRNLNSNLNSNSNSNLSKIAETSVMIRYHRLRWKSTVSASTTVSDSISTTEPEPEPQPVPAKCPMTGANRNNNKEKEDVYVDVCVDHYSDLSPAPGPSKFDSVKAMLTGVMNSRKYLQDIRTKYNTDTPQIWLFQPATQIFDPDIWMNNVLRKEWKLPYGAAPQTWPFQLYYGKLKLDLEKGDKMPIMLTHGEDEWRRPRHAIQTHLFSPKAADSYQSSIQEVADDASKFLKANNGRNACPSQLQLDKFAMDVSFEMLAMVLLDRRMGLLDLDDKNRIDNDNDNDNTTTNDTSASTSTSTQSSSKSEEDQFVESAVDAFHALGGLLMKPPVENITLLRTFSSDWNKLEKNMDVVWDVGMKWLEEAELDSSPRAFVNKLKTQVDGDDTLTMKRQERLVNMVTLLQAGVDTTSNSLLWVMNELARRPRIQRRLRRELNEAGLCSNGEDFNRTKHLPNLPYLKAFLREVHRYNPTAGGNMRRLPFNVMVPSTNPNGDNDKDDEEYLIEKNSIILFSQEAYGHDPQLLGGDPSEFLPERWLAAEHVAARAKADKSTNKRDPRKPVEIDLTSIDFDFGDDFVIDESNSNNNNSAVTATTIMAPSPILSNPLMSTPFSVGPRMCVGARVAQNEIYAFVIRMVLDFQLVLDPPDQPEPNRVSKLVSTPDPVPKIRFDPVS